MVVDTGEYGLVALIPMGMAMVSSVTFDNSVQLGSQHAKGDELGFFLFGGSDFVMLFQSKAGFELTTPVAATGAEHGEPSTTPVYTHLLVGEPYGVMRGIRP